MYLSFPQWIALLVRRALTGHSALQALQPVDVPCTRSTHPYRSIVVSYFLISSILADGSVGYAPLCESQDQRGSVIGAREAIGQTGNHQNRVTNQQATQATQTTQAAQTNLEIEHSRLFPNKPICVIHTQFHQISVLFAVSHDWLTANQGYPDSPSPTHSWGNVQHVHGSFRWAFTAA